MTFLWILVGLRLHIRDFNVVHILSQRREPPSRDGPCLGPSPLGPTHGFRTTGVVSLEGAGGGGSDVQRRRRKKKTRIMDYGF